jgi:glycosyltransferase involved in cell wall biosynthesis
MEPASKRGSSAPSALSSVDVTFFIPCYNEEKNVVGAIEKVTQAAARLHITWETLIFDDASQDRTVAVVSEYCEAHPDLPIRLFANKSNQGVSRNFVEGAFQGCGTYYRLVCGDDVEPLESHLALLGRRGEADIVVPYYTQIVGRGAYRHILSRFYTFLVNTVSKNSLRYYNGCPVYKRHDVLRWHVETTGFGYQAEFLTRLLHEGKSYVEVPLVAFDREGSGSVNVRNVVSVGHTLFKIALRRLRVYLFK